MIPKKIQNFLTKRNAKVPVFVLGCQRSGTTMLLNVFEKSDEFSVFHEGNINAYKNYRIKPLSDIKNLIERSKKKYIVFKPINDLHLSNEFLELSKDARAIWIYRDFNDVVNSSIRKWGSAQREIILGIITGRKRHPGHDAIMDGISEEDMNFLTRFKNTEISSEDGAALLWYIRNRIFLEKSLHINPKVILVKYEDLVASPEESFGVIYKFIGCEFSRQYVQDVKASSVKKNPPPRLSAKIMEQCIALQYELDKYSLKRVYEISG